MNRWLFLFACVVLGSTVALSASGEKLTYYVQLVRGNDEDQPPLTGARRIGPKLAKSLRPVFRWTNYWEVSHQEVAVAAGTMTKVSLSKERGVVIDLSQPKKWKVTALSEGKPICSTTQPVGDAMTIIGADRDRKSAWFVVVRRDKPTVE